MNEVNVLLADNPNFKFVSVLFAPFTGRNTYTYKTFFDVQPEDYVVIDTPSKGLSVVQVQEVLSPAEVDFDVSYNYKWVVSQIDTEAYLKATELEKKVLAKVNKSKNKRAMKEAQEMIMSGLDADTIAEVKALTRL